MNEQFDNSVFAEVGESLSESSIAAEETARVCPNCKSTLTDGQKFCPYCGTVVEEEKLPASLVCTKCGVEVPFETKFCPECGTPIRATANSESKEKIAEKKKLFLIGGIAAAIIIVSVIILAL